MIDIIILTKANRGISKQTLVSLAKYASESRIILYPNEGVNWSAGEKLSDYRYSAIQKATADWIYFLDDDDELLRPLPEVEQLQKYDYVLVPLCDKGKIRSLENCSTKRLFGFHMTLARREVAFRSLQFGCDKRYWSEDTAYLIWLIENCKGAKMQEALVQKNGDRIPFEVPGFREGARQENLNIFRNRLLAIRKDILPNLPLCGIYFNNLRRE